MMKMDTRMLGVCAVFLVVGMTWTVTPAAGVSLPEWMRVGNYFNYQTTIIYTSPEPRVDQFLYNLTILVVDYPTLTVLEDYGMGTESISFVNTFDIDTRISLAITYATYGSWLWVNDFDTAMGQAKLADRDYLLVSQNLPFDFHFSDSFGNESDLYYSESDMLLAYGIEHIEQDIGGIHYVCDGMTTFLGSGHLGGPSGRSSQAQGIGGPLQPSTTRRLGTRSDEGPAPLHDVLMTPPYYNYLPNEGENGYGTTYGYQDATGNHVSGWMRNVAFTSANPGAGARVNWAWGELVGPGQGSFWVQHSGTYSARFDIRVNGISLGTCTSPAWFGVSRAQTLVWETAWIRDFTTGSSVGSRNVVIYSTSCWWGGSWVRWFNNEDWSVTVPSLPLTTTHGYGFWLEYYTETRAGTIGFAASFALTDATLTLNSVRVYH